MIELKIAATCGVLFLLSMLIDAAFTANRTTPHDSFYLASGLNIVVGVVSLVVGVIHCLWV